MDAGISFNDSTQFIDLKRKGCFLEGLLHLALSEEAEVASLLGGATLACLEGYLEKVFFLLCDSLGDLLDLTDGLIFGSCDFPVPNGVERIA